MAAEGIWLGTYRFARYLTAEDAKRPTTPKRFGIMRDLKGAKARDGQDTAVQTDAAAGPTHHATVNPRPHPTTAPTGGPPRTKSPTNRSGITPSWAIGWMELARQW